MDVAAVLDPPLEILLSRLDAFTVGIEEYHQKCYNVNDAKGLYHDCSIILQFRGCKSQVLANLTGASQNQLNVVLCTVGSD